MIGAPGPRRGARETLPDVLAAVESASGLQLKCSGRGSAVSGASLSAACWKSSGFAQDRERFGRLTVPSRAKGPGERQGGKADPQSKVRRGREAHFARTSQRHAGARVPTHRVSDGSWALFSGLC